MYQGDIPQTPLINVFAQVEMHTLSPLRLQLDYHSSVANGLPVPKLLPAGGEGMEIKLDVSNPVMIQRAREQIEDAEKRAESMKCFSSNW